ncbi:MAG: RdgB/HAM1 family non-canonical purine NTP pyrophosphatase [Mobiluncus porci]|uniref:RdgB/HAM1 family non-canonical purine NTP pyrophosphatase n=1 Tax=Mobiluncus TaxID=2050 RepID=UPI0023F45B4B|nr:MULTISPECIES: RdgB/HAM1 family non-canonical purine NTP pyrophosphatase [Mobiluncus]MCI6584323.1 RdgB/HAM1 family non-canonical purine NTP pyrophosphatase [Mobiluncus sp.]MDD7540677.1 RdgB/HAM1 family non-canonical purine NTP pyrophosphatase [Mobiluncus porci]MDY5748240.1 RdgB/HAM1 family non-canonical purine NTP pyrophosphatase [Mobiluncus porci]
MSILATTSGLPDKDAAKLAVPPHAQVVMATGNAHKVKEVEAILRPLVPSLREGGIVASGELGAPEPVEDGTSFSANALIKARSLGKHVTLPVLSDDSGLTVDILGGAPGIFSARWCGHHGDDKANLDLLLNQLSDIPDDYRTAAFVCAAVLLVPGGGTYLGNGVMGGRLIRKPKGKNGFGYDPIFVADGQDTDKPLTNAELSPEAKNALSHRAAAFSQLAPQLEAILSIRALHPRDPRS